MDKEENKTSLEYSKSLFATYGTLQNKFGVYKFFDYIDDGILSDSLDNGTVKSIFKFVRGVNESFMKLNSIQDKTYKRFISGLITKHYTKEVESYHYEFNIETRLKNFIATKNKEIIRHV